MLLRLLSCCIYMLLLIYLFNFLLAFKLSDSAFALFAILRGQEVNPVSPILSILSEAAPLYKLEVN